MMKRLAQILTILLLPALGACDAFRGVGANTDVLARAEGLELTVDEAAALLRNQDQLPNRPEVVEALADLWVDYTLLALAANRDEIEQLDLTPVVRREAEQIAVFKLRDSLIRPDTALTEDELRRLFQEELPGAEVRARHILLTYPDQANDAQRDSVMEHARDLKERAEEGEDFAELAREYSEDPGSAARGGDLGFFDRDRMVEPFSDAAFAAEPGEITDPVQSPFGVHVIRVEERRVPEFEDARNEFRARIVSRRTFQAESAYVASLEDPAEVTIADGAFEAAREIARRPQMRLRGRAARRPLTEYRGGAFTAEEFRDYIQGRPPGFRGQVAGGQDPQIETLLRGLTRAQLLTNAARDEGFDIDEAERDSLLGEARNRVVQAARTSGLTGVEPQEGESLEDAVDRRVMATFREILAGEEDVLNLRNIATALREEYDAEVYDPAVSRVVEMVQGDTLGTGGPATGRRGAPPVQRPSTPQRAPNAPPDTTSR